MSNDIIHRVDQDGIPEDPQDAWNAFEVAWRRYKMGGPWTLAYAAYRELCAVISPDQARELRAEAQAVGTAGNTVDPLHVLYLFLREQDRQRRRTPRAKAKRKDLDTNRAKTPERQAAIKRYKAKFKAKKKAERLVQRAMAALEVA